MNKNIKGFSLLELIVALGIFVVVASLVVTIFGQNSERIDRQKYESEAYIIAESKIDELLVLPHVEGMAQSGNIANTPFSYQIDTQRQSYPGEERTYQLVGIVVSVFWSDDEQDSVFLKTLKIETDQ